MLKEYIKKLISKKLEEVTDRKRKFGSSFPFFALVDYDHKGGPKIIKTSKKREDLSSDENEGKNVRILRVSKETHDFVNSSRYDNRKHSLETSGNTVRVLQ